MKKKIIFVTVFCLIIIGGFCVLIGYQSLQKKKLLLEKRKKAWSLLKNNLAQEISRFKGEVGIVVEDLDMGWRISFGENKLLPSASLVKIPIMLACYYAAGEKKIDLKQIIALESAEKTGGSGLLKNAPIGSAFSIEDLIELMITRSDNTAANILIDLLGIDVLNGYFAKLGLKNTNLSRKMMDFKERKNGIENYTTANDMACVLEGIYHKKLINKDTSKECLELLSRQKINDRLPKKLPANTLVAHKTGLEYGVCHDAGIVFTGKGEFLICVLTKHNHRFAYLSKKFIAKIALITYNYYANL